MIRKIIRINTQKCNGCKACVSACHEGAIGMRGGKAALLRDDYCDGLGDCLPACPTGAITFEEREALPYDEEAVRANMQTSSSTRSQSGCPGSQVLSLQATPMLHSKAMEREQINPQALSSLRQWPVQLQLVPTNAAFLSNANILIAADCAAYARASFHQDFMNSRVTLIGCPKLDTTDYTEKLTVIFSANDIQSVTVVRMSVPCCQGIATAIMQALQKSCKKISCKVITLTPEGSIIKPSTD